jgi:hypothetical protein
VQDVGQMSAPSKRQRLKETRPSARTGHGTGVEARVTVSTNRAAEAGPLDTDALDGALDTLGCVFCTMRDVSFPLDLKGDTREFAALCDQFACHVEHGGAVPLYGIPHGADGDRQWAHAPLLCRPAPRRENLRHGAAARLPRRRRRSGYGDNR